MGDARGRWDGNTLVVETTNFNGRNAPTSPATVPPIAARAGLRVIERFKPVGPNTIEWSVTLDDATTWARPWTFAMNLSKDEGQPVFEYACHEGNYGLTGILSAAARREEKFTSTQRYLPTMCGRSRLFSWHTYSIGSAPADQGMV